MIDDTEAYILLRKDLAEEIVIRLKALEEKVEDLVLPKGPEWITEKELRSRLSVCAKTLQNYRNSGELAFIRKGRLYFYRQEDVQIFMDSGYFPRFAK